MASLALDHFKDLSRLLDEKNDKYERIYKTNRDITMKSKRVIFALQRIPGLPDEDKNKILHVASNDLTDVEQTLLKYIAMELSGDDALQFLNAYTGGIQEYVEAVSFYYFLDTGEIISLDDIQKRTTFKTVGENNCEIVPLSVTIRQKEFMLGLADLTGELMRFCIKSISVGDFDMCYKINVVLKQMKAGFLSLGYIYSKELYHKIGVFNSSLAKVEDACYSLQLRKSEVPPDMLADMLIMSADLEEGNLLSTIS